MLKVLSLSLILSLTYSSALHNVGFNVKKQAIYPNSVPPSDDRYYGPNVQSNPPAQAISIKAGIIPQGGQVGQSGSYSSVPAQFQFPIKQLPFFPQQTQFYPPQQVLYTPSAGPQNFLYIPPQRYPSTSDGNDQTGGNWFNYWPSQFPSPSWPQGQAPGWPSTISNFPTYPAIYPSNPAGNAPPTSIGSGTLDAVITPGTEFGSEANKGKPEKLEITESSQDNGPKSELQKNSVEFPPQQYFLLGQPQYLNQFAALQNEKDPLVLSNIGKGGAISSFLIYKDQTSGQPIQGQTLSQQRLSQQNVPQHPFSQQYVPQQITAQQLFGQQVLPQQSISQLSQQQQLASQQQLVSQKVADQAAIQDTASLAYQRFLLQNKQRSEEPTVKISQKIEESVQQNETPASNSISNANANNASGGSTSSA